MPDAQRIIEEIKHLLYSAGNPLPDEVLSVAADYQDLCNPVNDRLRACAGLLRRGLRSEAIQQADQEPNLLDLVATLDFAERPQWCDYLRRLSEMVPPDLLMDAATELNDAYAAEQPLLKLLRRHRKRALARAPLAQRIEVLRAIAQADPSNNVWQEDLQTFEVARHRQIEAEVNVAANSGDLPALATLESEVFAADWRNPPSDALRTTTKRSHARLRQQRARDELATLEPELTAAHGAFDVETARRLRGRWEACAQLAGLGSNELLAELAAPALAWLNEEDRREEARGEFDEAVYELEQRLDSGASREELVRAFHRAFRYEIELPARLESRLRERLAVIDAGNRRRYQMIVAGIVCALLALGAATTWAILDAKFKREAAEAAGHVKGMLDEGKLDKAKEHLDGLSPDIAASEPVRVQTARYHDLQKTEHERQKQFDDELGLAESTAEFSQPTLRSLDKADQYLKDMDAKHLAKRPNEQTRVIELQRRIEDARIAVKKRLNQDFARQLADLDKRRVELEGGMYAPQGSLKDGLNDLREKLSWLGARVDGVEPAHIDNYDLLVDRVGAMQRVEVARLLQVEWQQNITNAVGDWGRFAGMLQGYKNQFPDSARAHYFGVNAAEMQLWPVLGSWDAEVGRLSKFHQPQDWVAEAQKLLNDPLVSKLPMIEAIQARLPYYQAAANQADSLPASIKGLQQNALYSKVNTIEVRDSGEGGAIKRYYLLKPPVHQPATGGYTFEYVENVELRPLKQHHLVKEDNVNKQGGEVSRRARHCELLDEIAGMINGRRSAAWEATYFDAAEKTVKDQKTDPILRVVILKDILGAGKEGSLAFEEATRALAASANDTNTSVSWFLPDDADANAARSMAAGLLQNLPSFPEMRKVASERLAWMKQLPAGTHRWVGWLARAEAGDKAAAGSNWRCLTKEPVDGSGKLIVVLRPQPDGPILLVEVGEAKDGRATITLNAGDALIEGRPLFLTKE